MSRRAGTRRWLRISLAIGTVTSLVGAVPAAGYLRDFQVVAVDSLTGSAPIKATAVSCPPGKVAIGTGGVALPSLSDLGLNRLWVNFPQKAVLDGAVETDPISSRWRVRGSAFCATDTAVVPPPGGAGYLKDRSIVTASSPSGSAYSHEAIATCPAGQTAIGGGGRVEGETAFGNPPADVALDNSQRVAAGTGWRARAHEVDPTAVGWKVTASVICANITGQSAAPRYVGPKEDPIQSPNTTPGPPRSGLQGYVAPCPSGTLVIGGGAVVLGATTGAPPPADVVLTGSYPVQAPTATGWQMEARDTDPGGPPYRVQIRAVCG